jgi:hypothetical protein
MALLQVAEHDKILQRHCFLVVTATDIKRLSPEEQRLISQVCAEVVPQSADAFEVLAAVARAASHLPAKP